MKAAEHVCLIEIKNTPSSQTRKSMKGESMRSGPLLRRETRMDIQKTTSRLLFKPPGGISADTHPPNPGSRVPQGGVRGPKKRD